MKRLLICLFVLLSFFAAHAQLTKSNWLVGGTGNFLASSYSYSSATYSSTSNRVDITVSPNIGYFVKDKLAFGLRPSFSKFKDRVDGPSGGYSNVNRLEFGPFGRYYFLPTESRYNILADVSYQYGLYWFTPTKGNINTISAAAGPVIFFNSSVGLEFLFGYYSRKEVIKQNGDNVYNQKGFQASIGFQIHLEK